MEVFFGTVSGLGGSKAIGWRLGRKMPSYTVKVTGIFAWGDV